MIDNHDGATAPNYDLHLLYNLRDSFLNNSAKGRYYIANYYYIRPAIANNLNYSLASDCFNLFTSQGLSKIQLFLDNPNSDEPLFDNSTKNDVLSILNRIKLNSNDNRLGVIIDSFSTDLSKYANKSIRSIHKDFK